MKIHYIILSLLVLSILLAQLASAATLTGTIYNDFLEPETNVLIEVDTKPQQQFLSKDGTYSLELPQGTYTLSVTKGVFSTSEHVSVGSEGTFILDIFLLPDFADEDNLLEDTQEDLFEETDPEPRPYQIWRYIAGGAIAFFAGWRFLRYRKKYGPLNKFRKRMKAQAQKPLHKHKEELDQEPGYIANALKIIQEHDGRITQKQLRKEMLYLSEAKVSLIVTELEHKGKIEKVKKGRGNVLILK